MNATPFIAFLLFVFLAGCQSQPVTIYHTGSNGLTLAFGKDLPPATVYEDSAVPLLVTLANQGAWDVNYTSIVFAVKGDPFYVNITPDGSYPFAEARGDYGPPQSPNNSILHGKSPGWENGDFVTLQPVAEFHPIPGIREQSTTQLFASVCYAYGTVLGASVCVDANAFNGNVQKQVCNAETLTYKDQGAPVAITSVENRPSPVHVEGSTGSSRDAVQPVFIIHIQNVGGGAVLMPAAQNTQDLITSCSRGVNGTPAVTINATLGALPLVCKPNPVVLRNDEGYATCALPLTTGGLVTPNYLSTFVVQLQYIYRTSLSTDVTIQRSPAAIYTDNSPVSPGQATNPAFIGDQTRCAFCNANRNDPRCNGWPATANQTAQYGCACNEDTCMQLAQHTPGACVFGASWCPGASFCCLTSTG